MFIWCLLKEARPIAYEFVLLLAGEIARRRVKGDIFYNLPILCLVPCFLDENARTSKKIKFAQDFCKGGDKKNDTRDTGRQLKIAKHLDSIDKDRWLTLLKDFYCVKQKSIIWKQQTEFIRQSQHCEQI